MKQQLKRKVKRFKGLRPGHDIADAVSLLAARNKTRKWCIWTEFASYILIALLVGIFIGTMSSMITTQYKPKDTIEYKELQQDYTNLQEYHTDRWIKVCETYGDYICTSEPNILEQDMIEFTTPNTGVEHE